MQARNARVILSAPFGIMPDGAFLGAAAQKNCGSGKKRLARAGVLLYISAARCSGSLRFLHG